MGGKERRLMEKEDKPLLWETERLLVYSFNSRSRWLPKWYFSGNSENELLHVLLHLHLFRNFF